MRLDFNFPSQLMFHLALLELGFKDNLESNNILGFDFSGQINISKLSLSKRTPNLKIIKGPSERFNKHIMRKM